MEIKVVKKRYKEQKHDKKSKYKQIKKKAKFEYKSALKVLKEERENEVIDLYQKAGKPLPQNPPKRSVLEEVGNAVTHGAGAVFAVFAFVLMLLNSDTGLEILGAVIYFFGMFVMFTMSTLYHSFKHGGVTKRIFRRFDYSSIYLLIGATFAPILLCFQGGVFGIVFFIIQWAIISAGISLVGVFGPSRLRFIHIPMYVVLGWSGLMLLPKMISEAPHFAFWILGGGIVYSLGLIPFAMKAKVSHFIWHFFVLAGAVIQWVGTFLYIYL